VSGPRFPICVEPTNALAHLPFCSLKGDINANPANVLLREMVQDRKDEYHRCTNDHKAKNVILGEVVKAFIDGHSEGRRFLGRFTHDRLVWSEAHELKVRQAVRRLFLRDEGSPTPDTRALPSPLSAEAAAVTPSPRRSTTKPAKASPCVDFRNWEPFAAASENDTTTSSHGTSFHTTCNGKKRVTSPRSGSKRNKQDAKKVRAKPAPTLPPRPNLDAQPQGLSLDALNSHDVLCEADGCRRAALEGTGDAKVVELVRYYKRHPPDGADETTVAAIIAAQIGLSVPPGRFFEEGANGKWHEAGTFGVVAVDDDLRAGFFSLCSTFSSAYDTVIMTVRGLLRQGDAYFPDNSVSVHVEQPSAHSVNGDGNDWDANHAAGCRSNVSSLTTESNMLNAMPMFGFPSPESHAQGQRIILRTSKKTHKNTSLCTYQLHHGQRSADNAAISGQSSGRSPTERFRGSPSSQARKSFPPGFLQSFQKVKQIICGDRSSHASARSEGGNLKCALPDGHSDVPPVSQLAIQMEKANARDEAETMPRTAGGDEIFSSLPAPEHSLGDVHRGDDAENVRPHAANMDTDTDCLSTILPSVQSIQSFPPGEYWPRCVGWAREHDSKSQQG
jgi:hypothetical protein